MAEKMVDRVVRLMKDQKNIRNICTSAHIDHGKTTFSDNLLAGAGMMSENLAGKACVLDFHEDEIQRGITIDAASVSMVHAVDGREYLINLIDTPGHVDFGGDVTRAMRAIDGTVVLCCASEGVMPQTETVLRQALKERVKPVLFINKVDRLIKELQLTPQQMQERFMKIIMHVNSLIRDFAEDEFKEKWQVDVNNGSVAFGSAFSNWALSVPYMKKTNMTFADIIKAYKEGDIEANVKELAKKAPLHVVVLDMSILHHPDPKQAQAYRIPKIWHGDMDSERAKSLLTCDPNGPTAFVTTKIVMDKHAGEVAAGRLFSGKVRMGDELYLIGAKKKVRVQQLSVYNGAKRELIEEALPGNIIGIVGLKGVFSGETASNDENLEAFEAIKHIFDPVISKAIEAKNPGDLPKLVEVLRQVTKEDPTLVVEINEETGEHLIHGMGELHLEVIENRIKTEKGVEVVTSPPLVVYRETVMKQSQMGEGKSPNKHNRMYFIVEPLEENVRAAIQNKEVAEGHIKKTDRATWEKFQQLGYDTKIARSVKHIHNGNVLIDETRGEVHINEVMELVIEMFMDVMNKGPIVGEPCFGLKVRLVDCKLHEDSIHRGPAQMYPAVRDGIRAAFRTGSPVLYEPIQTLMFEAPVDYMGELSKLVSNKRGQLLDMQQEGMRVEVKAKMPVGEMFGISSDLRSATEGRGSSFVIDQTFEKMPFELQDKVIKQIRERKGLKETEESTE